MSAQEKEKSNLCMNTHEEYEKIEVLIDLWRKRNSCIRGDVRIVPDREDNSIRHNVLASRWESKQRTSTPVGQGYIRVVDDHGTESCAKLQIYQKASAGWWNLDTRWCSDKQCKGVTYQTTPITGRTHGNTVPTTLIFGYKDAPEQVNNTGVRFSQAGP